MATPSRKRPRVSLSRVPGAVAQRFPIEPTPGGLSAGVCSGCHSEWILVEETVGSTPAMMRYSLQPALTVSLSAAQLCVNRSERWEELVQGIVIVINEQRYAFTIGKFPLLGLSRGGKNDGALIEYRRTLLLQYARQFVREAHLGYEKVVAPSAELRKLKDEIEELLFAPGSAGSVIARLARKARSVE